MGQGVFEGNGGGDDAAVEASVELAVIGINSEKAIAFGVLLFLVVAAGSLVGGIIFLLKKSPKPSVAVADT